MSDISEMAKNKAQEFKNASLQATSRAAETVQTLAGQAANQARDIANSAVKGAEAAGSYLDQKAQQTTASVGRGLRSAGDAIRTNVPQGGRIGAASSAVAQTLSDTGMYVEQKGLCGITKDLSSFVRSNPLPALFMGVGLGFLLARVSNPRS